MKAYIGNKTVVLASTEMKDGPETQEGYNVKYSDGGETWLTKEIFDFEFRELTENESDLIMESLIIEDDIEDLLGAIDDDAKEDEGVLPELGV